MFADFCYLSGSAYDKRFIRFRFVLKKVLHIANLLMISNKFPQSVVNQFDKLLKTIATLKLQKMIIIWKNTKMYQHFSKNLMNGF